MWSIGCSKATSSNESKSCGRDRLVFSTRIPGELFPNRLAKAVADYRARGQRVLDLTASNPTRAGFDYPPDLLSALADPRGLEYAPQPLGLESARRAIASSLAERGERVAAERIALTASTSEAYSLIFKVLCNPGDRILVPRPSYPLLEHLARLDVVMPVPYDLEYHGAWSVDLSSVERALVPEARALLVVHPNNPTGSFVSRADGQALMAMCAQRDMAIVADEVFADYELTPGARQASVSFASSSETLAFCLGGLSKGVGLPQVKLGWIALSGPDRLVAPALERLEFACDSYLSASTPVQLAAPALLERGTPVRQQIQERVARNYRALVARTPQSDACTTLRADAGWYAVIRVPSIQSEESLVLELLHQHGVLVHPGYFFDFPDEAYLVVSLLPPAAEFDEAVSRLVGHVQRVAGF
jgi:aspartate/methionine/tyrosine aminotransferase